MIRFIALALVLVCSPAFAFGGRSVSVSKTVVRGRQQVVVQKQVVAPVRQQVVVGHHVQQVVAQPVIVQRVVAQPVYQQQVIAQPVQAGCSCLYR